MGRKRHLRYRSHSSWNCFRNLEIQKPGRQKTKKAPAGAFFVSKKSLNALPYLAFGDFCCCMPKLVKEMKANHNELDADPEIKCAVVCQS